MADSDAQKLIHAALTFVEFDASTSKEAKVAAKAADDASIAIMFRPDHGGVAVVITFDIDPEK
jgi:hypothetical protein